MRLLFWNVRGMGKVIVSEKNKEFDSNLRFDVLLLAEPKIVPKRAIVMRIGLRDFSDEIIHNGDGINKANIWVIYKKGLIVDVIASCRQQITVLVNNEMITVVHARSISRVRRICRTNLRLSWVLGLIL